MSDSNPSTTQSYEARFRVFPAIVSGYYLITCIHAYHGVETFYLSGEDWQQHLKPLLVPYWVNNYTIHMQPLA